MRAQSAERADSLNHASCERADEAQGIADGNRELAGTRLRRICNRNCWEICSVDVKLSEISQRVARMDSGLEFAAIPQLNRGTSAAYNVSVSD